MNNKNKKVVAGSNCISPLSKEIYKQEFNPSAFIYLDTQYKEKVAKGNNTFKNPEPRNYLLDTAKNKCDYAGYDTTPYLRECLDTHYWLADHREYRNCTMFHVDAAIKFIDEQINIDKRIVRNYKEKLNSAKANDNHLYEIYLGIETDDHDYTQWMEAVEESIKGWEEYIKSLEHSREFLHTLYIELIL